MTTLADIAKLVKLRTVLLMAFCSAIAYLIAGGPFFSSRFGILLLATSMGVAGSCTIHNYLDRDIDTIVTRTRGRPLPASKIRPSSALLAGVVLLVIGLVLALFLNFLTFILALLSSFFYLVVYTWIAKRKDPVNIILGSPAGGLPVLAGWAAATGGIDLLGIFLAILVIIWIPNHIWNLATVWSEDYRKADVPMLPAVNPDRARRCTLSTVILLFLLTLLLYVLGYFGIIYLAVALIFGLFLLLGNTYVYFRPTKKRLYTMFKFSSPYLVVIFLAMILDVIVI